MAIRFGGRWALFAQLGLLATCFAIGTQAPAKTRADLPPHLRPTEVNVTRNLTFRWGEPQVAVNPKNPNNLVYNIMSDRGTYACLKSKAGGCQMHKVITPGRTEPVDMPVGHAKNANWLSNQVFVSFDRGRTWKPVSIPRRIPGKPYASMAFGGDPVVEAAADGTFYIAWEPIRIFQFPIDGPGNYGCVAVSKSKDGGRTWSAPACAGTPVDHEWIEIDQSTGILYEASSGRLGPTSTGDPKVKAEGPSDRWLVTSKDGVNWSSPPRPFGGSDGTTHYPGSGRMIAANGELAAVFSSNNAAACKFFVGGGAPCTVFQTTRDAGATWKRHRIPTPPEVTGGFMSMLTAIRTKPGHYVVALMDSKASQFLVYRTADSGATWSAPTIVTEDPRKRHFKAAIASSPNGTVGIMWRGRYSDNSYDIWAAISDDEGATFTEPLRISSSVSPAEDPYFEAFDDLSDIHMDDRSVFLAWGDWRPGDRSGYFSEIKLEAFRHK